MTTRFSFKTATALLLTAWIALSPAMQSAQPLQSPAGSKLTDAELDQLLGPIALYPDPLLAQILPAASFVDQIDQAQRLLNGRVDENLIEHQNWDVSVQSIAHYPSILSKMAQHADWTAMVGQAYVQQEPDVERSIQRLRAQALKTGALQDTPQQQVDQQQQVITIEPAQPQVIYVPQYDPEMVYGGPSTGAVVAGSLVSFGTGMAIGAWLNRDWHWYGGGPYYHGWTGGGWVGANRNFVNVNNNYYVNNRFDNVNVNRNVVNRNLTNYRTQLDRNVNAQNVNAQRAAEGAAANRTNLNDSRVPALRGQTGNQLNDFRGRTETGTGLQKPSDMQRPTDVQRPSNIQQPTNVQRPSSIQQPDSSGDRDRSAFSGMDRGNASRMESDRGNQSLNSFQNRSGGAGSMPQGGGRSMPQGGGFGGGGRGGGRR
jgi:Protein of unknown function (DUF3300)